MLEIACTYSVLGFLMIFGKFQLITIIIIRRRMSTAGHGLPHRLQLPRLEEACIHRESALACYQVHY